jgi:hypothetical protein
MLNIVLMEYGLQRRRMFLIKGKGAVITSYITYILVPRLAYTLSKAYLIILMAPLVVQHVTLNLFAPPVACLLGPPLLLGAKSGPLSLRLGLVQLGLLCSARAHPRAR